MYRQLPKVYEPQKVETKWYDYWLEKGFFHAEVEKERKPFCIVIPPPNVTGKLHLGHALNNTLQDILTRYHRMKEIMPSGFQDGPRWHCHAGPGGRGIGEGRLSRHELGREEFLKRVWAWKEEYGRISSGN